MAGDEGEQDRTEQATPFKLREAKKRGQTAKSTELTGWLILLTSVAFVHVFGDDLVRHELALAGSLFDQSGSIALNQSSAIRLFTAIVMHLLSAFGFFAVVVLGAGLLANFIQVGPVFTWEPLTADFSRINPATGFKKLINIRIFYELIKTLLKLSLLTGVVVLFFKAKLTNLLGLMQVEMSVHASQILTYAVTFSLWLLAIFSVPAMLDFAFTRWEFAKNMRMSRREQKDEHKRREGDPKIKARIRELQREAISRSASLQRIPDADVVITNPTHISVAIRYERGQMPAPLVIAKGAGELALKMRIKARQHNIPLTENKALARKLFERVRIDQPILPETYPLVAKILTSVYQNQHRQSH